MGRDERRCKFDRGTATLYRGLLRCWGGPDIASKGGYCLGRDGIEQRLDQELSFSDATRRGETVERQDAFFSVVPLFQIIRWIFNGLQLAKEPSTVEAGVGEEPCDLSKNFSFLKGRSLVAPLSPHVFQFNRELGENDLRKPHAPKTGNAPATLR